MGLSRVRALTAAFFMVYLLAVTWPLAVWVSQAEPLVLGLPLPLFWAVWWIVMSFFMLLWLDHAEQQAEQSSS